MKTAVMVFLLICLAGTGVVTKAGECCAWGQGGDPPYLRIVRVCCYWIDSGESCCNTSSGGIAYCNSYYYVMGEFMSSDFYYVPSGEIQQLICGFGV